MKTVTIRAGRSEYNILAGPGLLAQAGQRLREIGLGDKAVIITDSVVAGLYGNSLKEALADGGIQAELIELPQGEGQKSLDTAAGIYTRLTGLGAERSTPVLALGGGVIGDLAGFVAATYLRGVPLVQLPTTFLSQGDSSIGGKVAVNHGSLKNRIGAFYHPRLTISDTDTLKSLGPREVSDGLAEIIKHGVILDGEFFDYIQANLDRIKAFDDSVLEYVISRSAAIKGGVVEQDELDLGLRNILNFGHTVGHAIEAVSGLKIWHGEAVAIGMLTEARIAVILGHLSEADMKKLGDLVRAAGLPRVVPSLHRDELLRAMAYDKKNVGGRIKFVLPKRIGEVFVTDEVLDSVIREALEREG